MTRHPFSPLESLLGGETLETEYKQDLDRKNKSSPMDTGTLAGALMALGNAQGGTLLLGVEDKGRITGIHASRTQSVTQLRQSIAGKFAATPELAAHSYDTAQGKVWAFYIVPATKDPYQLGDGTLRIRRLDNKQRPENVPLLARDIPSWQAERGTHYDFSSSQIADLTWEQHEKWINPLALDRFESRLKAGRVNNSVLQNLSSHEARFETLGLIVSVGKAKVATNAVLILFGRNEILRERLPGHDAQFQKFDANGALPLNLFLGQPGFEQRCLLLIAERLDELFRGNVARRELMDGLFRVDVPDYGDDALREATMNAFIHRDYTASESVVMQLHPQRFTISNPGGFFRDVTPENLLFHEPCPRNRCLAQACADLGLVEKSGRGVDRIFWDQIRFFRPLPSYSDSTSETVRLVLEGGETSLDAVRWMFRHFDGVRDLNIRLVHGALLHRLFFDGEVSREELMRALPDLNVERGQRALTELIDAGLVTRIGHGRGQRLVLSHHLQQEMGCPEAFIHQTGLGDEQRRQMILTYVGTYGKITRAEAAKLLHMPADNAVYRLLFALVERGELVKQGDKRYAVYHKP